MTGRKGVPIPDPADAIKTADLQARLGVTLTVDMLSELGFKPVANVGNAKFWKLSDVGAIIDALKDRIEQGRHA